MWYFLLFGLLSGVFSKDQRVLSKEKPPHLEAFTNGNYRFTGAVYKELIKNIPGNVVFSPISAETILALTIEGAKGQTALEMISGLSLPNTTENIRDTFGMLWPILKTPQNERELLTANKIYVNKDVRLENSFKDIATSVYESGIETIDFSQKLQSANIINSWVEENTNHKIKNLVNPNKISEDSKLVLVNALYFSSPWYSGFGKSSTEKTKFYITQQDVVELDTMQQTQYLNYYENSNLNAKFLEMKYIGLDISMVVVLPNKIEGLASLEKNIEQIYSRQPYESRKVNLAIPKFTIETEIDFVPILKSFGIRKAFEPDADFSGISSTQNGLSIGSVIQKAFINVTEEGSDASMFSRVAICPIHYVPPIEFKADHPFAYYIKFKDLVLFSGRFISP